MEADPAAPQPESAERFVLRMLEIYDEHGTTPVFGVDAVIAAVTTRDALVAAAALERAAEERAKMRAMLLRMAAYREDARHAIKKEPEHRLVQVLQDGANIGYEASALWSKYATDADWEANGGADG